MKELKENNRAFAIPIKTVLVLVVVICSLILLFVYADSLTVECDSEDKVELQGQLLGFTKNGSYWNVKLDNQTYVFDVFDESYMKSLIGFDITINACFRHDTSFQIGRYDMCCAYINEAVV